VTTNARYMRASSFLGDSKLNKQLQPHQQRLVEEKDQLKERRDKLIEFLQKGQPDHIDDKNWALLNEQADAMNWYYTILISRIDLFEVAK